MTDLSPAPAVHGVLEAAVYATDLDAAEGFYGGVLGLARLLRAGDRHVFFRAGGTIVLVFNPERTGKPSGNPTLPVPPHGARGPGHICFTVQGRDIGRWQDRLIAAGIEIEAAFAWPNGARSVYVRDPANNSVEFAEAHLWD